MNELFTLENWHVIVSKDGSGRMSVSADVHIEVRGEKIHTAADGVGPVDALYNALYKALKDFYPQISELCLTDYWVNIVDSEKGTAAKVKVIVRMKNGKKGYFTESVSPDILEASWDALVQALTLHLLLAQSLQREEVIDGCK